jgi:hypothetical protein
MGHDWDNLEGVDATERIFCAGIAASAGEIHLSSDGEGAAIFFITKEGLRFFTHLPKICSDGVRCYLKTLAAIDCWKQPPVSGFGVFRRHGKDFQVEVKILQGTVEQDVTIKISTM